MPIRRLAEGSNNLQARVLRVHIKGVAGVLILWPSALQYGPLLQELLALSIQSLSQAADADVGLQDLGLCLLAAAPQLLDTVLPSWIFFPLLRHALPGIACPSTLRWAPWRC